MDPTTTAQDETRATVPPTPPMDQATPSLPTAEPNPPALPRDHQWRLRPYPIITPAPNSAPRWQQLIHDPTELDIKSYSGGQDADFHAGTLNIGGSLRERITDISYTFAATGMDYLCLQDTRQTKQEGLAIASTIRELLPPGTLVFQAPITKTRPSDPPRLVAR